ncbi:hypothetical protein GPECTOR_62g925 [Gonium pectorale]|uniref:Uncharacterized protein n=1 Tax=Gonium pectorale TaxID=33097 RepID=A0A150G655_GONPE|nr:hypothetical protein GPECTOR_62g925 [Gonium pectorale]|eukprot:KXZ44810.1 hypothetical protein GPECTOR_62g925 [Gonium pectorale]
MTSRLCCNSLPPLQQQQQQQQRQEQPRTKQEAQQEPAGPACDVMDFRRPSNAEAAASEVHVPTGLGPGSSCASMASHPSGHPSDDSNTVPLIGSPCDSVNHSSSQPVLLSSPSGGGSGGGGGGRHGETSLLFAGRDLGPVAPGKRPPPRDAASFTASAGASFDTGATGAAGGATTRVAGGLGALVADPTSLFARAAAAAGGRSLGLAALSSLELDTGMAVDRLPSHGTVSSFVGAAPGAGAAPPSAFPLRSGSAPSPASALPASAFPQGPVARQSSQPQHGHGGSGIAAGAAVRGVQAGNALSVSVPSLEQLIARAITGNGTGGAGAASGAALLRHSSGGHLHGISVSHATGHGHVGKTAAAGWARGGGVNAAGRPTRSARTKAVFAALEAEVAGKLAELEALRSEHATLAQRVEILEVAVQRQSTVLNIMNGSGGGIATGGAGGMGGLAAAAAAAGLRGLGGLGVQQPSLPAAAAAAPGAGFGLAAGPAGPWGMLDPFGALPDGAEGAELIEWARRCSLESYKAHYKEHLQALSLALLAVDANPGPESEERLVQLVAAGCMRTSLVCVFQPLVQLRLKGLNLETNMNSEPPEAHWMEVIKFMTVGPTQIAEMENLFHSYNLLHGSFRAELQDTQRELVELVSSGDGFSRQHCSERALDLALRQTALLKRVRSILQKTHLLYSCTIGVAAMRILKPKEFAKCCVQSYPYFPCGPSLMKACAQLRALKAIFGVNPCATGCG